MHTPTGGSVASHGGCGALHPMHPVHPLYLTQCNPCCRCPRSPSALACCLAPKPTAFLLTWMASTGMAFAQQRDTVRHLSILLSTCDQEATRQLFAKSLTAIRLCICCWSKFDLSFLGRVHVAKQVLANSLYVQALASCCCLRPCWLRWWTA
jgi:hypothetical protein